jgi:RHS repeat-associated protein
MPTDPNIQNQSSGGSNHPLDRYTVQPQKNGGSDGQEKSPYFKSQAPSISLPKGGGALKGIDEKFNVNAVNGTAGLDIPFPLSPGRSGFTPSLSIAYNSGSGNSEFGMGWAMSLSSIQRKTDKKLPQYNDAEDSDVFLLAGAEDLVPKLDENGDKLERIEGEYKITEYIPRIEGLFARIEFIRKTNAPEGWWRIATKDNILTYYGLSASSRIADPEAPSRIFKWLPEITVDHKGNVQQFFYVAEDTVNIIKGAHETNHLNDLAPFANTYLKSVAYCNLEPYFIDHHVYQPQLPEVTYLMEAVLDYGEHDLERPQYEASSAWDARKDAFSDFHAGFEIRSYRRCRRVLMFHRFRELSKAERLDPTLVRSLDLAYYQDQEPNNPSLPNDHAGIDYILSITQTGYYYDAEDRLISKSLPPITLDYQAIEWDHTVHTVAPEDWANAPQGLTGNYQWTDFFGEGLPGILSEQGNAWWYKRNLGEGHFTHALNIAPKPSLAGLGNSLQWQDLDADGRRQVVSYDNSLPGYFEASLASKHDVEGIQEWESFQAFKENINIDWNSPHNKMLDLDGDGRPDLLLCEDRVFTWYKNQGKEGFGLGGYSSVSFDEDKGPRLLLNDPVQSVFLADLNGDGLTDLVRIRNGEVCYWPNKGYGRFGAKVTMSNAPTFDHPDTFNPQYIYISDISGTGAADILYLAQSKCMAYINRSGNSFSEGVEIATLPGIEPYSKVSVIDFLGNGTGCIVWSSPLPQYANAPLRYIDLMAGKKPHLMKSYSNGMGKTVALKYKSSTKYYLADKIAGTPWATKLPFPVHCIEEITTSDAVSETTYKQSYAYHHGYYDHAEREFRGFGRVDTIDTEAAVINQSTLSIEHLNQDPVLTKSWYHTGAWMEFELLTDAYAREYFIANQDNEIGTAINIPAGLSAKEQREAYRALKGSPLRQEIYALDGSAKEGIPYAISSFGYCVLKLQSLPSTLPPSGGAGGGAGTYPNAVFYNYQEQKLSQSCERFVEDPRVAHEITLEIDEYGNVLQAAQIVYPRVNTPSFLPAEVADAQEKMHISYSRASYTNDILGSDVQYRLRLPYEGISCELYIPSADYPAALWSKTALLDVINPLSILPYSSSMSGTSPKLRKLSHSKSLYRENDATTVLAFGEIESLAIPHEEYTLAFSDDIIATPITATLLDEGSYIDLDSDGNYWIPSGQAIYATSPATRFYSITRYQDPWNNQTIISYWRNSVGEDYWMLPKQTRDTLDNKTIVEAYDWRILQPTRLKDINENISEIAFDALGMPVAMAVKGKDDATEGDNLDGLDIEDYTVQDDFWTDPENYAATLLGNATMRCIYDLAPVTLSGDEGSGSGVPTRVAMIGREMHFADKEESPLVIRITYTDGFGRIAMHKVQCEPVTLSGDEGSYSAAWIGSGKTIYNNKGNTVRQYEPYFSETHAYDTAEQAANLGVSPSMHYDALGRVRRTDMPDGTFSKTIWDGWMQVVYDANDTCEDSDWYAAYSTGSTEEQDAATKASAHYDTPTISHLDSLGRPFYTVQLLEPMSVIASGSEAISYDLTGIDHIASYENLDITSNRLSVVDGRGNTALSYTYNLLQVPMQQISIDSGTQHMLADVAGQPLYAWDADNREFHFEYDVLRRPTAKTVTYSATTYKIEETIYGEGITIGPDSDTALNMRGQVYCQRDNAGESHVTLYDFKGSPKTTTLELIDDHTLLTVDWAGTVTLTGETFTSSIEYDALGRPISSTDPGGNLTENSYDKGGMLKSISLNSDAYVNDIHYDSKGRREAIWYGNGTKTSYEYDPKSYRLTRLRTIVTLSGDEVQDLNYYYDAVGNITTIRDNAQEDVWFANTIVTPQNKYTYDSLYRLIEADGRERKAAVSFGGSDNADDSSAIGAGTVPWDGSSTALQHYTQFYEYDAVGNILSLQHSAGTGSYTRDYNYGTGNSRLNSTDVGATNYPYTYDNRGNMLTMPHLSAMLWNPLNELQKTTRGTTDTYFNYSGGERIRKVAEKTGGIKEERIYLGTYEIYRKFVSGSLTIERTTVHISDDTGRIAMLEERTVGSDAAPASLQRYIYSNHVQTASLELDENADIISYEEYHPFGTTAYQASNSAINALAKRYRYTGKERDEETGLYYYGARYYVPWLAKWTAIDPMEAKYGGLSPYNYTMNNPVMLNDPSGADPCTPHGSKFNELFGNDKKSSGGGKGGGGGNGKIKYGGFPGVSVASTGDLSQIKHGGSAADKTSVYRHNPTLVKKAIEVGAAKTAYNNQPVLMADIYGNGHSGPRAQTEAKVRKIQKDYNDAVGANIAGGFFGALGYMIAGDEGSFAGAAVDNAAQAAVALREAPRMAPPKAPKVKLEPAVKSAPAPNRPPTPQTAPVEGTVYKTVVFTQTTKGVTNAGEMLGDFGIPKLYIYTTGGKSVFVTPHAMKHLEELAANGAKLGTDYLKLLGQTHQKALHSAIDDVLSRGPLQFNTPYFSGGNKIIFGAPRTVGELPAVKHFSYGK